MTGLERIVEKIAAENKAATDAMIAETTEQANRMIATAREDASNKAQKIVDNAKAEADRIVAVAKSQAESLSRKRYLQVRNAVVNDILSAAYEKILTYDDAQYFDLLLQLCIRNCEKGEGVMYLSAQDLQRLPQDFEDRINAEIYETGAVQVSRTPKEIDNGFVLVYGDIEINCTLRAVFDERMDALKDLLHPLLFPRTEGV